jgi:hypothetical protein
MERLLRIRRPLSFVLAAVVMFIAGTYFATTPQVFVGASQHPMLTTLTVITIAIAGWFIYASTKRSSKINQTVRTLGIAVIAIVGTLLVVESFQTTFGPFLLFCVVLTFVFGAFAFAVLADTSSKRYVPTSWPPAPATPLADTRTFPPATYGDRPFRDVPDVDSRLAYDDRDLGRPVQQRPRRFSDDRPVAARPATPSRTPRPSQAGQSASAPRPDRQVFQGDAVPAADDRPARPKARVNRRPADTTPANGTDGSSTPRSGNPRRSGGRPDQQPGRSGSASTPRPQRRKNQ